MFTPLIRPGHSRTGSGSWLHFDPQDSAPIASMSYQAGSLNRRPQSSARRDRAAVTGSGYSSVYNPIATNQSYGTLNANMNQMQFGPASASASRHTLWSRPTPAPNDYTAAEIYWTPASNSFLNRPVSTYNLPPLLGSTTPQLRRKMSALSHAIPHASSTLNLRSASGRSGSLGRLTVPPPVAGLASQSASACVSQMQLSALELSGIYGWRKRCLYFLLSLLCVLSVFNLAALLWISSLLQLNPNGFGPITIADRALTIDSLLQVSGHVLARQIESDKEDPLLLRSNRSIVFESWPGAAEKSAFQLDPVEGLRVFANQLRVFDSSGRLLFASRPNVTDIRTDTIRLRNSAGLRVSGSLQTSSIVSEPGLPLHIESLTRPLTLTSGQGMALQSRHALTISAHQDLHLHSVAGQLVLEAESILLRNASPLSSLSSSLSLSALSALNSTNLPFALDVCICAQSGLLWYSASGCSRPPPDLCQPTSG